MYVLLLHARRQRGVRRGWGGFGGVVRTRWGIHIAVTISTVVHTYKLLTYHKKKKKKKKKIRKILHYILLAQCPLYIPRV